MTDYSRLMERDEIGTLERQKQYRRSLIDPTIGQNRGQIVKTTGDGLLVEFASVQDAVRCALDIQTEMRRQEADKDPERRIRYRIGINLGDVLFDDSDIFGDGVNVASRLEGLAEPGGICISDIVHQSVQDRFDESFRDMGGQRVKNISRPIRVWQWAPGSTRQTKVSAAEVQQQVRFCTSADGTHIAYASVGDGSPLLRAPHWLNHLEYEFKSPFLGPFLEEVARHHRLVRFDQRGNGLSDWDVERISVDAMIEDMEAVVAASGLERFGLLGISQGAAFAVRYAEKHPDQVSCLVLFGGYLRGRLCRGNPEEQTLYDAAKMMIQQGWGSDLPIYRNFFTSAFLPEASKAVQDSFDESQRISINAENAFRIYDMNAHLDSRAQGAAINVPALVIHIRDDRVAPLAEGRLMARTIPGAQFVELPGGNHLAVEGHPNFEKFFEAMLPFVARHAGG